MIEEARASGRPLHALENERFRYFNHMSVGGLVLRKWRLADAVAEAARFHHDVETNINKDLKFKDLDSIVALANVLVNQPGFMSEEVGWDSLGALACTRQIQVTPAQLREIASQAAQRIAAQRSGSAV
jgi:HD-like signal output (HDOD) protein